MEDKEMTIEENIDAFEQLSGATRYADFLRELHGIPTKH